MNQPIILTPGIGTMNLGDQIIHEHTIKNIDLSKISFTLSSHQYHPRFLSKIIKDSKGCIFMGSNCIPTTSFYPWRVQILSLIHI